MNIDELVFFDNRPNEFKIYETILGQRYDKIISLQIKKPQNIIKVSGSFCGQ